MTFLAYEFLIIMALVQLAVSGQAVVAPAGDANPAALFKELGVKFKLDEKVVKYFIDTEKLGSLDEFCKMVTCEQEISDIIKQIAELERPLQ